MSATEAAAAGAADVVTLVDHVRGLIADYDRAIAEMHVNRQGLLLKLAALEAAADPAVLDAAADYDERIAEGRGYEDARDAGDVIAEAHRRFVP